MKQEIIIIYNPSSGKKRRINLPDYVSKYLDFEKFEPQIWTSESSEHMLRLAEKAAMSSVEIVVAAGGDGTVNAVASMLVNTDKKLYVFPLGSGNGFARHFNIPVSLSKSIQALSNKHLLSEIDCAKVNNHHFTNVAGVGFDAHISQLFANNTKRGFWGYFKAIIKELNYKPKVYKVETLEETWEGSAFLISVANCTQWGNNVFIAPMANPKDGKLDLVVLKNFNLFQVPAILYQLLTKKVKTGTYFKTITSSQISISCQSHEPIHTDGEALNSYKELDYRVEGKLNVIGF